MSVDGGKADLAPQMVTQVQQVWFDAGARTGARRRALFSGNVVPTLPVGQRLPAIQPKALTSGSQARLTTST